MRKALSATASALEATTYPRPVSRQRASIPGAFGELFAAKEAERSALESAGASLEKCVEGCAALDTMQAAADALLDAGRAERGGTPLGAGPFAPKNAPPHAKALVSLCRHSKAAIARDVRAGHAEAGALRCAGTIEVARDFVYGGTVLATATAAACVEAVAEPCRAALAAAPEAVRTRVRADLGAAAASLPPFADAALAENVRIELGICGSYLDAAERERLGPRGREVVLESDRDLAALPAREKTLHLELCHEAHDAEVLAVAAYRAPKGSPDRDRAMAEYTRTTSKMRVPPPPLDEHETRYDRARSTIESLAKP